MLNSLKRVYFLLDKKLLKKFFSLSLLTTLVSLLEIIGLSIFIPLFNLLLKKNSFDESFFLNKYFEFENINQILICIMLVFTFRYLISLIQTLYNNFILAEAKSYISRKIFSHYVSKKFIFHIKRNSSELLKNTFIETGYFVNNILRPLLKIISDIIFIFFIIFFLAIYNLNITLISFFSITIFSIVFFQLYKNITSDISNKRIYHDNKRLKFLTEGLKAIKEINIYSLEKFFVDKMSYHNHRASISSCHEANLLQIPKLLFEFFIIIIFVLLIFFNAQENLQNLKLIENIVIFGACITRLMPIINSLTASFQSLRFHHKSADIIYKEINDKSDNNVSSKNLNIKFQNKFELEGISFSYDDKKIFENLNMFMKKGEILGITGDSGSGKSSLINILLGLLETSNGKIKVDGVTLNENYTNSWRNYFAYIPHNSFMIDDSIKDNIIFGSNNFNENLFNDVIKFSELEKVISEFNREIDYKIGESGFTLSTGQIQRLGIARGLYKSKQIIVLDEATNALDIDTETKILSNLVKSKKEDVSIILITHRKNNYRICDRVYEIKEKKLIEI